MKILQALILLVSMILLLVCGKQEMESKAVIPKVQLSNSPSSNVSRLKVNSLSSKKLPELKTIVRGIEKYNMVEGSHIGEAGTPSKQWERYEQLKKAATINQLIALTDHKNPVVRCYAFEALVAKNSDKVFAILLKHLYDESIVSILSGCRGWSESVGNYYLSVVAPEPYKRSEFKLNDIQRKILDSVLKEDKSDELYNKFLFEQTQ